MSTNLPPYGLDLNSVVVPVEDQIHISKTTVDERSVTTVSQTPETLTGVDGVRVSGTGGNGVQPFGDSNLGEKGTTPFVQMECLIKGEGNVLVVEGNGDALNLNGDAVVGDGNLGFAAVGGKVEIEEDTADMEVEKQDTGVNGTDFVSNQEELCSVEGNMSCGDCVMVDADSAVEVNEGNDVDIRVLSEDAGLNGNQKCEGGVIEEVIPPPPSYGVEVKQLATEELESIPTVVHEGENVGMDVLYIDTGMSGDEKSEGGVVKEVIAPSSGVEDKQLETTELVSGFEQSKNLDKRSAKRRLSKGENVSVNENQTSYCLALGKEGEFSTGDMVWGKVKSHPWWPGQIYDPSDASEQAMKHYKKDRLFVAYFGDQSFAWNEASLLKSFKTHFSQMEKQSNMEAFHDAVNCALDEVGRRVEFGFSCPCRPKEATAEIKSQAISNGGICEGVCRRDCTETSLNAASFEPDKIVEYIKVLAMNPCGGADRVELVIAQAQLAAFYLLKGNFQLPEFHAYEGLSTNDADTTPVPENSKKASSQKRKVQSAENSSHKPHHDSEDNLNSTKKEKSLTDLMGGNNSQPHGRSVNSGTDRKTATKSASQSSGKKSRTVESSNDPVVRKRKQKSFSAKDCDTESPRSSKVGERISKIASQLTGSPSVLKYNSEKILQGGVADVDASSGQLQDVDVDFTPNTPQTFLKQLMTSRKEDSTQRQMLSQLFLVAQNPTKRRDLTEVVGFFTDLRKSICLNHSSSAKRKKSLKKVGSRKTGFGNKEPSDPKPSCIEAYDYECVSDSYWTDRIIQSSPEDQPSCRKRKRKADLKLESSLEDYHDLEQQTSTDLNPTDSKKHISTVEPENCIQLNPVVDSTIETPAKDGNLVTEKTTGNNKEAGDSSPTALILKFDKVKSIPLESELNRIFSRFGPLDESKTEILRKTSQAKVVFQSRSDADVAFTSAGKFSTFGPALVSYQLQYLPSTPSGASSRITRQSKKDAV